MVSVEVSPLQRFVSGACYHFLNIGRSWKSWLYDRRVSVTVVKGKPGFNYQGTHLFRRSVGLLNPPNYSIKWTNSVCCIHIRFVMLYWCGCRWCNGYLARLVIERSIVRFPGQWNCRTIFQAHHFPFHLAVSRFPAINRDLQPRWLG